MNTYRVTFAKLEQSATHTVRGPDTIERVTACFACYLPQGWTLTVERIV